MWVVYDYQAYKVIYDIDKSSAIFNEILQLYMYVLGIVKNIVC